LVIAKLLYSHISFKKIVSIPILLFELPSKSFVIPKMRKRIKVQIFILNKSQIKIDQFINVGNSTSTKY